MSRLLDDPRIDPRIKAAFGTYAQQGGPDVSSREELFQIFASPEVQAALARDREFADSMVPDDSSLTAGVIAETMTFVSRPDGNVVKILYLRPDTDEILPCICYLHGGGMAAGSAYDVNYQAWGRIIAAQGVAVAMVDFRNCMIPSSAPEVAPFPAGLNDCVSGLRWVSENARRLRIDAQKLIVAGDSGGGNLTLASGLKLKREGDIDLIGGIYALCPYIAGQWPHPDHHSTLENEGIFLNINNNHVKVAYGEEAFIRKDPLAWPLFASSDELRGLPQTVISLNECDPLRDEGLSFYRNLLAAGVPVRCRMLMGTIHAVEIFPRCAPDICANTANDIAYLARTCR